MNMTEFVKECNFLTGVWGQSRQVTWHSAQVALRRPIIVLFKMLTQVLVIDKTKGQRMQSCQGPVDIYLGCQTIPPY